MVLLLPPLSRSRSRPARRLIIVRFGGLFACHWLERHWQLQCELRSAHNDTTRKKSRRRSARLTWRPFCLLVFARYFQPSAGVIGNHSRTPRVQALDSGAGFRFATERCEEGENENRNGLRESCEFLTGSKKPQLPLLCETHGTGSNVARTTCKSMASV